MYLKYIKQKPKDHNLYPVDVQDYKDISHHFKGICEMYLKFKRKTERLQPVDVSRLQDTYSSS